MSDALYSSRLTYLTAADVSKIPGDMPSGQGFSKMLKSFVFLKGLYRGPHIKGNHLMYVMGLYVDDPYQDSCHDAPKTGNIKP